jgi:hypothetical protein
MTGDIMLAPKSLTRTLSFLFLLSACGSSSSGGKPDAGEGSADAADTGGAGGDTGEGGTGGTVRGGAGGGRPGVGADAGGGEGGSGDTGGSTGGSPGGGTGGTPGGGTGGTPGGGTGGTPGGGTGGTPSGGVGGGGAGGTGGSVAGGMSCDSPIEISMTNPHTDITVNNTGGPHLFDLACSPGGPQLVLSFMLAQRELVYADTFGASWNTILSFSSDCSATVPAPEGGTVPCNNDACGTMQSQAMAVLGYGRHYLVISGVSGAIGSATIHFQHAPVGNQLAFMTAGTGSKMGTTSGMGAIHVCEASGPDSSYWWNSCPTYPGGAFSATTCNQAMFDTILSLHVPRTDLISCADDDPSCGNQSTLTNTVPAGAGINVLTVDSSTASNAGAYTITYTRP